jgi:hypothetical protein
LYLCYLSKPASHRPIYRAVCRQRARKILQLGIGTGRRALRLIEAASLGRPVSEVEFSGIDLFEARSAMDGPGLTLKMTHRLLRNTVARIRLVPGDPLSALAQIANDLGQVDLVLISARLDPQRLAPAWFYLPRLLHERSQVFIEQSLPGGQQQVRLVPRTEIESLAAVPSRRAA